MGLTMRAVLLTGHGGPEKLEYRENVPVPEPQHGEVLVRVGAAGVNSTDILTREGGYGQGSDPESASGWRSEPMQFPRIQGIDIVGRITSVGPGVDLERIGQRVLVDPAIYTSEDPGLSGMEVIGSERNGGFAEYVAVPSVNAHAIHSRLSDPELATFPCAYGTGERMLNIASLAEGETILVTGASGGVGSGLLQLARARGAKVIALTGSGKEDRATALGVERVVTREPRSGSLIDALGRQSVDVVADVVGGALLPDLLAVLKPEGRYVVAGSIAGPMVQMDLRLVYLNLLQMFGSSMWRPAEFKTLLGYIETGKVRPLLAQTYGLADINKAQEDFKQKDFFGKLVLVP